MFLKRNDTFQIECGERALARPKLLGMLPRKKNYDLLRHSDSVPRMRRIMYLPYPDHYNKTLLHQTLYF